MADEIPEWQRRLESAMAQYVKKRTAKTRERAQMAENRAYGLAQRHARKLARNRQEKQP